MKIVVLEPLGIPAERVREILKTEMEHTAELSVPLTVDAHIGHSWAEAH